jgi:hypothetical protein
VASIVVRHDCKGFGLVADFTVDLATGFVNQVPGNRIETPQLAQLRRKLFALAESEKISPSEVECFMAQIAPARAKIETSSGSCHRAHVDSSDDDFIYGTVDTPRRDGDSQGIRVVLNRHTGELMSESTFEVYHSPQKPQIENLRTELVRSHSPARLSVDEVRNLVEMPVTAKELVRRGLLPNTRCKTVDLDPSQNADEAWFQIWVGCEASDESKDVVRLSVNLLDGAARVLGANAAIGLKGLWRSG